MAAVVENGELHQGPVIFDFHFLVATSLVSGDTAVALGATTTSASRLLLLLALIPCPGGSGRTQSAGFKLGGRYPCFVGGGWRRGGVTLK